MNKYVFALLLLLSYSGQVDAQTKNTADTNFLLGNFHQSALIWKKVVQSHGGKDLLSKNLHFEIKGVIQYMGHYDIPEKTISSNIDDNYNFFEDRQLIYISGKTIYNGKTYLSSSLLNRDSIFIFERNKITSKSAKEKNVSLASALRMSPTKLVLSIFENQMSLRLLKENDNHYIFTYILNNENICLFINKKTFLLDKFESIRYDSIYGEIVRDIIYENYTLTKGVMLPYNRSDYEGGRIEKKITFINYQLNVKPDTSIIELPLILKKKIALEPTKLNTIAFEKLTDNIHLVKFLTADNKSLVVDMGESIAIFESFADVNLNKQMIDSVSKLYPNKPIKTLFVTHHHPDHAGGIKAFADKNITIVTTKGNPVYFQKLLIASHFSKGVYTEGNSIKYDLVDNESEKVFGKDNYKVVAYEIGKNTDHTQEHLVFYFPKDKIMWTGDLLYFSDEGEIEPSGKRGKAVYNLIQSKKLTVANIYTAWPLNSQKKYITIDDLIKSVNLPD
jgi:glyoxylase-like metal-dependent hydrolase (beta-lactamase superfamily II)